MIIFKYCVRIFYYVRHLIYKESDCIAIFDGINAPLQSRIPLVKPWRTIALFFTTCVTRGGRMTGIEADPYLS